MPCNCDHMHSSQHEQESRNLMELMKGAGILKGEVPYYGEVNAINKHTAMLCKFCQENDVKEQSLELQIWWRDHQKADKKRIEQEIEQAQKEFEREKALRKLTPYEKKLLGI